jgi:cytochrome c551/c552
MTVAVVSLVNMLAPAAARGIGGGVWGAIPMPPNNVPDAGLKTLVEWILAAK